MKKVIDFDKINETSKYIKDKCNLLDQELGKIINSLSIINEVDKTDNITKLLSRYNNEVNDLKKFINVMDYYTNYMDKISGYYSNVFNDYQMRLKNNLNEIGGSYGKNRF